MTSLYSACTCTLSPCILGSRGVEQENKLVPYYTPITNAHSWKRRGRKLASTSQFHTNTGLPQIHRTWFFCRSEFH
jgi:hypothetical protein